MLKDAFGELEQGLLNPSSLTSAIESEYVADITRRDSSSIITQEDAIIAIGKTNIEIANKLSELNGVKLLDVLMRIGSFSEVAIIQALSCLRLDLSAIGVFLFDYTSLMAYVVDDEFVGFYLEGFDVKTNVEFSERISVLYNTGSSSEFSLNTDDLVVAAYAQIPYGNSFTIPSIVLPAIGDQSEEPVSLTFNTEIGAKTFSISI